MSYASHQSHQIDFIQMYEYIHPSHISLDRFTANIDLSNANMSPSSAQLSCDNILNGATISLTVVAGQ